MDNNFDLNWGGPGFPSYEGRLDGEGVMDAGERADAALAAFSGEGEQQQDDQRNAGGGDGGEQQQDGQQRAEGEQQQERQDGQLTDEQIQADPRYQELSGFRDSVVNALSDFPGLVDDKGQPNLAEASLQLKDASVLYDIMSGKGTPSALLEVMAQNAGWSDQQKQAIAKDLIGWLTKGGYLKDGQAAAAGKDKAGFKDPVQERLDKIEREHQTERQSAEQQRVKAHQEEVFKTKFLPNVEKLCTQKGIPKEDFPAYAGQIAQLIQGNKAILSRIEKGNFVDIQKFFTQVYNAEVARLQRWTKAQTAAADKKKNQPRIPTGGAPPAAAGSAKTVNVKDRDSRIAAAADML